MDYDVAEGSEYSFRTSAVDDTTADHDDGEDKEDVDEGLKTI